MSNPTHLSLFSGIGGIDLASEWAGFQTVGQCEWADFPTQVLEKHWPDTPRWRDIKTLTKEDFYERTGRTTVDLISGGFPCQPFSQSGKQLGEADDRYLWPEMVRVIRQLRPNFILGENVAGLLRMGFDGFLADLEAIGYRVSAVVLPAVSNAGGGRFRGDRVFIIAAADSVGWHRLDEEQAIKPSFEYQESDQEWRSRQDDLSVDFDELLADRSSRKERDDDGLSEGMDRLKAVGNAVVPQQVYPILQGMAQMLKNNLRR